MKIWLGAVVVLMSGFGVMHAQSLTKDATGPGSKDPLALGKAAMDHGDMASARKFFTDYTDANPKDAEAWFCLGGVELQTEHPAAAITDFKKVLELKPDAWNAHNNLSVAYAEVGNWKNFDIERALLHSLRDAKTPGLSLTDHDLIDVLHVKDKTYNVWYFYTPHGTFHARYVAVHFDADGKADSWIQAESDDADQAFIEKDNPKLAKAGGRMYSLDSYQRGPAGYPSQALHKFYEGEPTYEVFRADVLQILQTESKPVASMTPPVSEKK